MIEPSPGQQRVLDFVLSFIDKHGYSPTMRDIAAGCGFASPNASLMHMRALQRKGFVTWKPGRSRTARVECESSRSS